MQTNSYHGALHALRLAIFQAWRSMGASRHTAYAQATAYHWPRRH